MVWKTDTILNVKNFMWNLLSNSLAVMKNLSNRGMNVSTNFLVYGLEEDIEHMIYTRRWAEAGWFSCLGAREPQHTRQSMGEWIQDKRKEADNSQGIKETRWNLCMLAHLKSTMQIG